MSELKCDAPLLLRAIDAEWEPWISPLVKGPANFFYLEAFNRISCFDIVIIFKGHSTFIAFPHFFNFILKALDSWDPGSITVGAVPLNSRVDGNYEKQLWKIEKENNDCYFIISKHSSKCLDSRGPGNNRIGKSYKQTPEHQAYASQLWKITKEYDSNGWFNGCYFIRNDHSGARLDSWGGHDGGGDTGKTVSHHAPGHPAYPHQLWKLNIVPYDKYRAKEGHRQMEMELHLQSNGRPRRDSTGNGGHDRLER